MTRPLDTNTLCRILTARFGVGLQASQGEDEHGPYVDLRPMDLHQNEGFSVRAYAGWRSVRAQLAVGQFGAELLSEMARSSDAQRATYVSLGECLADKGGKFSLQINGNSRDPLKPADWPRSWSSLELKVERFPVMLNHDSEAEITQAISVWAGGLLGMVVALLPVEEVEEVSENVTEGLPEGAVKRIEVNKYERSSVNRALCISAHGAHCKVCGFDFEDSYGELGRDYIHVHHVVPVSKLGADYQINPVTDLAPVCPNCHAMLHRREPPLDIDELQKLLRINPPPAV